jgi:hypothetical protein
LEVISIRDQRGARSRRIPEEATLKAEITAWNRDRNAAANTIDWRFTTADARIKLKHLDPAIHP